MSKACPWLLTLSCITLGPGCYGNFVDHWGSGAAGQTETSTSASASASTPSASTATPDSWGASTDVTEGASTGVTTFLPTGGPPGPMDPSTTSGTVTSTGDTPAPGTTAGEEPPGMGCPNSDPFLARTVFVTARIFNSQLRPKDWNWEDNENGAERGDVLCQCVATNAGLAGSFAAWLSDDYTSIRTFIESQHPAVSTWNFVDSNNNCIADSWSQFISGSLTSPIVLTERKTILADWSTKYAWTGTFDIGITSTFNCQNWTGSGAGTVGDTRRSGPGWSALIECPDDIRNCFEGTCGAPRHLYCIQLDGAPVEMDERCIDLEGG